jgi:hypothetical protein
MKNKAFNLRRYFLTPVIALFLLVLSCEMLSAQEMAARPERGFGSIGGHQSSGFDSIDLKNGTVNLQFPLASLPPVSGGKLGYALSATYNSKLWDVHRAEFYGLTNGGAGCQERYITSTIGRAENAGWRIGGGYEIFFRDAYNDDFSYAGPVSFVCDGYDYYNLSTRFFKPMLRAPDGSERHMAATHATIYRVTTFRPGQWRISLPFPGPSDFIQPMAPI